MAIVLDFDPLSSEPREPVKRVPVKASDPSKGVIIVTIRDIPRGRYGALSSAYSGAMSILSDAIGVTREEAQKLLLLNPTLDELKAYAAMGVVNAEALSSAWQLLFLARSILVRWGIAGHHPDSFVSPKGPILFEASQEVWEGVAYSLAGPRMIALYDKVNLLGILADAVMNFNDETWKEPEQIWEEAKKKAEEAKKKEEEEKAKKEAKKEGEAKADPPKQEAAQ